MNIIQIGCNNGSDDVFSFITKNKDKIKKALLVDANPIALKEAQNKYEEFSFCEFKNLAILPLSIKPSVITLYAPSNNDISGFSSVSKQHVVAHAHSEDLIQFNVEAISLHELLKDFFLSVKGKIDHLFIDTEGLDALNLFSVNFDQFPIENITFEYIHTDGIVKFDKRLKALIYYLQSFGFHLRNDPNCQYNLIASRKLIINES